MGFCQIKNPFQSLGKKIQGYEVDFDETNDKLTKGLTTLEEREKAFKNAEEEVSASAVCLQFGKLTAVYLHFSGQRVLTSYHADGRRGQKGRFELGRDCHEISHGLKRS